MHNIKDIVEVILFASNKPIKQEDVENVFDGSFDLRKIIKELNRQYNNNQLGIGCHTYVSLRHY